MSNNYVDPVDVSVWVSNPHSVLKSGKQYKLNFRCFSHQDRGEPLERELKTRVWFRTDDAVILAPEGEKPLKDNDIYTASFDLIIPTEGDSEIISFDFIPRAGENRFFASIDVCGDVYRELSILVNAQ
jgi:hypothetical protein